MKCENLQKTLIDSLEVLARITGGYATVTDKDGVRLKTVDSSGCEIESLNYFYSQASNRHSTVSFWVKIILV